MTRSILVTGSAGFIGARLCRVLREMGYNVTTIDLVSDCESVDHHILDIASTAMLDDPALAKRSFDAIIHLAAAHRDDIKPLSAYFDVNVTGSSNICELARRIGVSQIIFTSSVAVYGFAEPDTGEDGKLKPFNEYGRTKALAEEEFNTWLGEEKAGRSLVIVRPTVVFGPDNRGNVYNLMRQLASGFFVMFGDGRNRKSMAYVENIVAFLVHCLSLSAGRHVYNYVDKPDLDMNTLVRLVRKTLGMPETGYLRLPKSVGMMVGKFADIVSAFLRRPLPVSSFRVEKFCATTQFSSAAHMTGFTAPVPLTEGLAITVENEFGRGRGAREYVRPPGLTG